ncbi:MAG: TonB-dependent receptor [Rhodospirillaceae bacterium]|nr:TonB-dependent receptor [Rhodospirillaceae bacterium]
MRRNLSLRAFTAALTLTTVLGGIATEALAQIEEIVVTTRKREENLQEVPIVIQAFTSEAIERKGIADLKDIAKYTSGVMFDTGFGKQDTRVVIRGLSPTRGRQNVAILQDEVDISSLAQGTAGGSFVINPRLQDVERIEVVKGPHPALFGRSAFSGAISYISRQPGDEFRGNAQLDLGTYQKAEGRVGVSGPVVADKLSLGFNGSLWNDGGFYDSSVTGHNTGGGDGWGVAASAKFTPNDTVKFNFRTEYSKDYFDPESRFVTTPTEVPLPASAFTAATGLTTPVINGTIATNRTFPQVTGSLGNGDRYAAPAPSRNPRTGEDYPGSDRKIFRNTLRGEFDFDSVLLTSISHYGDNSTFQYNDAHGFGDYASPTVNAGQESYFETDIRLLSQELRLQSQGDGPFQWTAGGLFWNEKLNQATRNLICVAPSGGCAAVLASYNGPPLTTIKRDTYHYSGYALFDYDVTDKLSVDIEVRYTTEKEDTSGFATVGADITPGATATSIPTTVTSFLGCPGGLPSRNVSATGVFTCATAGPLITGTTNVIKQVPSSYTQATVGSVYWAPRFTVDYKVTDDALVYASAALGKKPGGLSPLSGVGAVATNIYDPESMWVYELGTKTTWADGRVQFNGAVYYQDYSKKQVSITFENPLSSPPNQLTTRVVNAASASVKGLEFDLMVAPTDFFTGTISYTYNDGQYDDFKDISNTASAISRAAVRNPNNCTVVAAGNPAASRCVLDYSGYRLEGASKHSLQMGGQVRGDITADLGWFFDTDVRYQSKRYTSFENSLWMDSYWNVDMRAGVKTDDWTVTAYVNNVLNDDTIKASAVYLQAWMASYQPPRPTGLYSFASGLLPDKRQFGIRANVNF